MPLHGLVYGRDGALTYFIRRFDREGRNRKVHVEDFAQLSGHTRETKYRSSMEQVAGIIETFCTFPAVEHAKLFRLTLFSFLVGNEDLHLKNFSLIHRGEVVALTPAYDLLNTTIVLANPQEELALPLRGKKSRLKPDELVEYFGRQRLGLTERTVARILEEFRAAVGGRSGSERAFFPSPCRRTTSACSDPGCRGCSRDRTERIGG